MSMPANFQPFWKPFGHSKQGNRFRMTVYICPKSVSLFWMTKGFPKWLKTCKHTHTCIMNLQTYSYMYNEYAYKFSAILEIIWSSKTGSLQFFF